MIKMPFGLSGSPSTFQRLMERVLDGLLMKCVVVYLDDINVFAETEEQLYENLLLVFACVFMSLSYFVSNFIRPNAL